jgi:hypothetical protein
VPLAEVEVGEAAEPLLEEEVLRHEPSPGLIVNYRKLSDKPDRVLEMVEGTHGTRPGFI